ncbi:MAG: cation:dicarboxylase symporter family transporter [Sphaerochaetaceae bacterium]
MKTWHFNLISAFLGLLLATLIGASSSYNLVINTSIDVLKLIVYFLFFPMIFFTLTAAIASLKKDKGITTPVFGWSFLWNFITAIILCLGAAFAFYLFRPEGFKTFSKSTAMVSYLSINTFQIVYALPIIIILAIFIGRASNPDESYFYPAYAVLNSFSEVFFRVSKTLCRYAWFAIFFFSGFFFKQYFSNGMFSTYLNLTLFILMLTLFVNFLILPLIVWCFSGFKKNPFIPVVRLLGPSLSAFFSNDPLFYYPQLYFTARNNLGVQKRIVGASLPLSLFISKGGTAMISTLFCALVASQSTTLSWPSLSILAFYCSMLSFVSGAHFKTEMLFICITALNFANIKLDQQTQLQLLYSLPLVSGFGYFLDAQIAGLAAYISGIRTKSNRTVKRVYTI